MRLAWGEGFSGDKVTRGQSAVLGLDVKGVAGNNEARLGLSVPPGPSTARRAATATGEGSER